MQAWSLYCNGRDSSNMDIFSSGWSVAETQVNKSDNCSAVTEILKPECLMLSY